MQGKGISYCFFVLFADLPIAVILRESGESRNIQAAKRLDLRIPEGDKGAGLRRQGRQEDLVIATALEVFKAAC
jgi:hypothetical protein